MGKPAGYTVGRGRPPLATQKGNTAARGRRKSREKSFVTLLLEALAAPVAEVADDGRRKRLAKRELGPAHYAGLLRADFASFAQHVFAELHPRTRFQMNWHLRVIAARFAAVRRGKIRRLAIHLSPRHLKSLLDSVAFPAWVLGHDPSAEILCVSYAQELADKWSRDCRRVVLSPWYRALFPTRLAQSPQAMAEFETTAKGCRIATSVGGVLTGRGADLTPGTPASAGGRPGASTTR